MVLNGFRGQLSWFVMYVLSLSMVPKLWIRSQGLLIPAVQVPAVQAAVQVAPRTWRRAAYQAAQRYPISRLFRQQGQLRPQQGAQCNTAGKHGAVSMVARKADSEHRWNMLCWNILRGPDPRHHCILLNTYGTSYAAGAWNQPD